MHVTAFFAIHLFLNDFDANYEYLPFANNLKPWQGGGCGTGWGRKAKKSPVEFVKKADIYFMNS